VVPFSTASVILSRIAHALARRVVTCRPVAHAPLASSEHHRPIA
jgi:hypothetical protein